MRTGCSVDQREVVAIVLEDIASALTSPCQTLKKTIDSRGVGRTKNMSKDFLHPDAKTTRISRGRSNGLKRKCCTIWLDTLPDDIRADLKRGEILPVHVHMHCTLYCVQ